MVKKTDPYSGIKAGAFTAQAKRAGMTLPKYADYVINNYKDKKFKPAFTQMADNARDLLGYKYNPVTGKFGNNDNEVSSASEAVKINDALEKNFQDHKQHDYLKTYGIEESSKKEPGYPKLADVPILNQKIK